MTQKRNYKQYPKEFKDEAVALVLDQGYSVPEAAKSLGIAASMLSESGREEVALKRIYERENYNQDDIKHFKEVGFVNVCFN